VECPAHGPGEIRAQRGGAGPRREVEALEAQLHEPRARRTIERARVGGESHRARGRGEPRLRVRVPAGERHPRSAGADGLAAERGRREREPHVRGRPGARWTPGASERAREPRHVAGLGRDRAAEPARERRLAEEACEVHVLERRIAHVRCAARGAAQRERAHIERAGIGLHGERSGEFLPLEPGLDAGGADVQRADARRCDPQLRDGAASTLRGDGAAPGEPAADAARTPAAGDPRDIHVLERQRAQFPVERPAQPHAGIEVDVTGAPGQLTRNIHHGRRVSGAFNVD
jgi:hypothetical protein